MGNASALAGFLLLLGATTASPVDAQARSVDGAFARLSPGHQKVARALFDAQRANTSPAAVREPQAAASAPRALTLDEIAVQKQPGHDWGQVFHTMKSQGLVRETNLGQVVSRYEQRRSATATAGPAK